MPRLVAFGGLTLLADDVPVVGSVARGRNLALLALLARAGGAGLTREKLAAFLWPESDAERSRHSLDQALYTVRRALGSGALVAGGTTLVLDPSEVASDVGVFTAAVEAGANQQAVDLYKGPFLDGFHVSGAAEFERWVDAERAVLHGRYVTALEALACEAAAAGDVATSLGHWQRLAAAEPFSSRVALCLMRALEDAGDRPGALEVARVHAGLVRNELGAPPDPSIVEYTARLRRESGSPAYQAATSLPERRLDSGPTPASAASGAPARRAESHADRTRHRSRPIRVWWWIGLAATGITAVAFVTRRGDPPTAGERPRVAVTPFENETDDAAFRPVARMASDWITEGLVRTGLVKVIDPEMSDRAAESIVSGRIYRTGDTVWLHAWIVEPENGAVLRALDAVGADASDPSTALEPLRQQVLGALGTLYDPRLTAWAESALRPPSYAAYRQFVAGVELLARPRDPVAAAERFRRATELDANYLLARLWLAWTFTMMGEWSRADSVSSALEPRRDDMSPLERAWHDRIVALLAGDNEASYRAARRMVEIAPRSGWVIALANASLDTNRPSVAVSVLLDAGVDNLGLEREYGWFLLTAAYHELGDHRRELASTEEAIRAVGISWGFLGPGVPALAALGRIEDLELRLDELRDARPLEYGIPAGPASLLTAATELRTHGFHDAAASLVAGRLERETDLPAGAEASAARWARLKLAYEMGKWDDAERLLHELAAENPDGLQVQGMTGLLAARRGDTASAHRIATGLAAIDRPFLFGEPTLWRARIESVLGSPENAIALLRQAFAEGQGAPAWYWLHVGRDFDALDDEPAFQELVRPRP